MRLENILGNRRWERHDEPFPYVYAQGVFTDAFYGKLASQYGELLGRGISEKPTASHQLSRNMTGYDAYGTGLGSDATGAFALFNTREWHDMMGFMFNVKGTGYIAVGMHHHAIGSKDGFIHNDINPVWFPIGDIKTGGRIQHPNYAICHYKTGAGPLKAHEKIEVCRGVVMIFYLCNGEWHDGWGGETGFYTDFQYLNSEWAKKIPPYDNSLIMYECTPKSWHSFLSNKVKPRNSIIMWIHRPIEEVQEIYGDDNLERWGAEEYLEQQRKNEAKHKTP